MSRKLPHKENSWKFTIIVSAVFISGLLLGGFLYSFTENSLMEKYDLYNCIYNNADLNSFNQHPKMIKAIQDECVCFREHNYTNLLEADC